MVAAVKTSPKYHVDRADAEILGQTLNGLFQTRVAEELIPVLEAHGLGKPDAKKWYPLQDVLDVYHDFALMENSMSRFVAIGVEVFDTLPLPKGIRTIEDGLHMLNDIHDLSVRNVDYTPYEITRVSPNEIRLVERTPFPHDLIYGYIYGIARRLRHPDTHPVIVRTFMNPNHPDSDGAFYTIRW